MSHPEDATVRDWTDLVARIRFGVVRRGRKTVSGATIKAVAGRLSTYADPDGSRVFPGLARLAVDLEMSYDTVKMAVSALSRVGLLRLVKAGVRRGHADEYHLAIPTDLLDRDDVECVSGRHALEVERIREATRGRRGTQLGGPDDDPTPGVRGVQHPAQKDSETSGAGCPAPCTPVDNETVRGAVHPARDAIEPERAGCSAPANPSVRGAQPPQCRVLSTPPPTKDLGRVLSIYCGGLVQD